MLERVFTRHLVDEAIEGFGRREKRVRALPDHGRGTFRPIHRGKLSQPFLMGYDTSCDRGGILVQAEYRMWDSFKGYPRRTAQADMKASQFERIRDDGILVVDGFISGEIAEQFALAIERLAELELGKGGARPVSGNGYYVRNLIEKDRVFHPLLRSKAIGIAHATWPKSFNASGFTNCIRGYWRRWRAVAHPFPRGFRTESAVV